MNDDPLPEDELLTRLNNNLIWAKPMIDAARYLSNALELASMGVYDFTPADKFVLSVLADHDYYGGGRATTLPADVTDFIGRCREARAAREQEPDMVKLARIIHEAKQSDPER